MKTGITVTVIRVLLVGINHSIVTAICMYLIMSGKFAFEERAIYATCAVLFWMGTQRLIKRLIPAD